MADQRPRARRPAAAPKSYPVNHVVGLDLVEVKAVGQQRHWRLKIVCWWSSFQLVGHAGTSKEFFVSSWVRVFGYAEIVAVDPGTEFQLYFGEVIASSGVAFFPTDARAPRQNGHTERPGG